MNTSKAPHLPSVPAGICKTSRHTAGRLTTCDTTYRDVLGAGAWSRLAPEIRQRFAVRPTGTQKIVYRGLMERVELSFMGWLFAQFCRLIGTPLAPYRGSNVRMDIELSWNEALQGVTWDRRYHFDCRRSQTVSSTKSHDPDGGFIELVGRAFLMRLALTEENGKLVFTSSAYEIRVSGHWMRIPAFLTPGVLRVIHEQIAGDRFRFRLSVLHPVFGQTIYQDGEFYSADSARLSCSVMRSVVMKPQFQPS